MQTFRTKNFYKILLSCTTGDDEAPKVQTLSAIKHYQAITII